MRKFVTILLGVCLIITMSVSALAEDAGELMELATLCKTVEYSGTTVMQGNLVYTGDGNMSLVPRSDDPSNQCLKIDRPIGASSTNFTTPSGLSNKGIYTVSCDIMIPDVTLNTLHFSFELQKKSDGSVAWFNNDSFLIGTDGKITIGGTEVYDGITSGTWYNICVSYDPTISQAALYVNGTLIATKTVVEFTAVGRVQIAAKPGYCFHIDNVRAYTTAYKYAVSAKAVDISTKAELSEGVDYNNPCIALEFTQALSADTVIADNIKLLNGTQAVESNLQLSDDKKTVYVNPTSALLPNTEYTISVGEGVQTSNGAYTAGGTTLTLKTAKLPFSIKSASADALVSDSVFNLTVYVNNKENISADSALIACVYDANGNMVSANTANVTGTEDNKNYTIQLRAPEDVTDAKIKIFLINNFTGLVLIDTLEL